MHFQIVSLASNLFTRIQSLRRGTYQYHGVFVLELFCKNCMTLRALFFAVVLSVSAHAQTSKQVQSASTALGAQVRLYQLQSFVRMNPMGTMAHLQHVSAVPNPDTLVHHDVLRYACYVPATGELALTITPASMRGNISVVRKGAYGGRPIALITIDPFRVLKDGRLACVDSLAVDVSWSTRLARGPAMVPPISAPFLNPEWSFVPSTAKRTSKSQTRDLVQDGVDPSAWYDPSQQYARIETRVDGVAIALADDIIDAVPALDRVETTSLALFHRGVEQRLAVIDNDSTGTFTSGDNILFVGSHPKGDTTFLDLQDTTAIFFLTSRLGKNLRLIKGEQPPGSFEKIRSLLVRERIELDTGYYHPGSADNEDYSTYATPMTLFEGFYWESLNARAKQSSTHQIPFTPSGEGDVSIKTDVYSSSNSRAYAPDHAIDVSINGGSRDGVIGEGYQHYRLGVVIPSTGMPSGQQSIRVYATGIPELALTKDWFSEVLIDGYDVEGFAAPVLDQGRLRGKVSTSNNPMELVVDNASAGAAYAIDTTSGSWLPLAQGERGVCLRSGISPEPPAWPNQTSSASVYQVVVGYNDDVRTIEDFRGYVVSWYNEASRKVTIQQTKDPNECASLIASTNANDVIMVYAAGAPSTQAIETELRVKRCVIPAPGDTLWVVACGPGESSISSSTNTVAPTRGTRLFVASSRSFQGRVRTTLPAGFSGVLVIGAGSGVEQARVRLAQLKNLSADSSGVDVFVVTHSSLLSETQRWADFRSKKSNKRIRIVDVDAIIDEFDAGRHSPDAVRLYLKKAFENAPLPKPTHCVLIGNASWDVRLAVKGGNARSSRPDLVPTFGKPSSDYWMGLLDDPQDVATPELIVSRFPVLTSAECTAMVDKIITADTSTYAPWNRRFLFVGGGETEDEGLCRIYESLLSDPFETGILYTDPTLCIDTLTVCKGTSPAPGLEIRRMVNEGTGLMNYIGHGGTEVFDIKGWDPEDLSNAGRYPVLATYSCLTGAFSNSSALCRNGSYLVQPNAGFVAAMGASGWQYIVVVSQMLTQSHEVLRTTGIRDVGRLTYATKRGYAEGTQQFDINAVMQFNLLGDPFTRIYIDTTTQLSIAPNRVVITSPVGGLQIREDNDSAYVDVEVWSEGTGTRLPYLIRCIHTFGSSSDTSFVTVAEGPCRENNIRFVVDVEGKVGRHNVIVDLDPTGSIGDRPEDNRVDALFQVYARSLLILEPDPHGIQRTLSTSARIIDILSTPANTMQVHMVISTIQDTSAPLLKSLPSEIIRTGSVVDWKSTRPLAGPSAQYEAWLGVWAFDTVSKQTSAIAWQPVYCMGANDYTADYHLADISHATSVAPTLEYDSAKHALKISSYDRNIHVRSSGIMTSDPDRNSILVVKVGETTILENSFRTGLNIVVIGQRDTVPRLIRRYDTSKNPAPIETGHYGFAQECLTFLRDSILNSDRVVVAACNESFSRFITENLLDSLKVQLRALGSQLCDSLDLSSSFALVGSGQAAKNMATEAWKGAPTFMVTVDSFTKFHYQSGTARGPIHGPASRWFSVQCNPKGTVRSILNGMFTDGTTRSIDTTNSWAPTDGATGISSVYYQWELIGTEDVPDASVDFTSASYQPLPQWIIESNAMKLDADSVLRGNKASGVVAVRNARTSFSSPLSTLTLAAINPQNNSVVQTMMSDVRVIGADEIVQVAVSMPTAVLPSNVTLVGVLDPDATVAELFRVRDRCQAVLTISDDTLAPQIEPYVDSRYLPLGGWVYQQPKIEIRVRDNSPLSVVDPERLVVFVNGLRVRETSVVEYEFLNTAKAQAEWPGSDIRAAMRFRTALDLGDNLLIVRATDATNNSDTLEIPLLTSNETRLESVTVAPNPSVGPITFTIVLVASSSTSPASISVFDVHGRLIRTMPVQLSVGQGQVTWDSRGNSGEFLAQGVYTWRLNVEDASGNVENTTNGTLLVLR